MKKAAARTIYGVLKYMNFDSTSNKIRLLIINSANARSFNLKLNENIDFTILGAQPVGVYDITFEDDAGTFLGGGQTFEVLPKEEPNCTMS